MIWFDCLIAFSSLMLTRIFTRISIRCRGSTPVCLSCPLFPKSLSSPPSSPPPPTPNVVFSSPATHSLLLHRLISNASFPSSCCCCCCCCHHCCHHHRCCCFAIMIICLFFNLFIILSPHVYRYSRVARIPQILFLRNVFCLNMYIFLKFPSELSSETLLLLSFSLTGNNCLYFYFHFFLFL